MREVIQVQDAADIHRVRMRVLTRRRLPRIEVGTQRFPKLAAQFAQDRFGRLAASCNCLFGEVLGGLTLLGGTFMAWVSSRRWRDVGLAIAAALVVMLIGKAIEIIWTRLRMLWVLQRLRRRLDSSRDLIATKPVGYAWIESPDRTPLNSTDAALDAETPRTRLHRARRSKVLLGNAADINRLSRQLAWRWTLPRIEIGIECMTERDRQRVQHRYMRLTDGASFMLAGVLAALTLLGGAFLVILGQSPTTPAIERPDLWAAQMQWADVQPVLIATLCAGFIGVVIELAVTRMRLLWVLRGLRRRLPSQG